LTALLQGIIRPTEVNIDHFESLGVHVTPGASPADLIPDPAYIPDFAAWDQLSPDEAHSANESTRRPLNTGNLSPGCVVYLDRKRELSIPNEAAFRAVRRVPPPMGQNQARLGNSFEFFRHLEMFASFWDDTSQSKPDPAKQEAAESEAAADANARSAPEEPASGSGQARATVPFAIYRTSSGHQMPPEYRHNILTAFLKLVAYDFGCNVSAPRTEPRLYITSPPQSPAGSPPETSTSSAQRSSYFSSGCTFIFRTPKTREAARGGIVEGPLAAVSARHTTSFPPSRRAPAAPNASPAVTAAADPNDDLSMDRDSVMDLARELVAALLTAQHRARQGKAEKRIGQDAWWATKPRWGGGPGGPIGREIEMQSGADQTIGDKDEPPASLPAPPSPSSPAPEQPSPVASPVTAEGPTATTAAAGATGPRLDLLTGLRRPPRLAGDSPLLGKAPKRLKKSGNLPMYDNYRRVRPPGPTWDVKTKYEAIGRRRGPDYDDVFVISSLFHHVSVLRVRVPDRLLEILEGAGEDGEGVGPGDGSRSWGKLEVWRSPWYDFFKVDERLPAMQLVWSMMAYLMRQEEDPAEDKDGEDVEMGNS
jgi:hypothetical protein